MCGRTVGPEMPCPWHTFWGGTCVRGFLLFSLLLSQPGRDLCLAGFTCPEFLPSGQACGNVGEGDEKQEEEKREQEELWQRVRDRNGSWVLPGILLLAAGGSCLHALLKVSRVFGTLDGKLQELMCSKELKLPQDVVLQVFEKIQFLSHRIFTTWILFERKYFLLGLTESSAGP